jgi:UDP-glucose 4-epimerase
MRILVTGGAGYVGCVSVEHLVREGHEVTVLDTLVTGHRAAVPKDVDLVTVSFGDRPAVAEVLRERRIEAVLHCAARSLVGESVEKPALYYGENVVGGVAMLDAMRDAGVGRIVFSSTAAVYGVPDRTPIDEESPLRPINPYGETKRAFEGALRWYAQAYGLRAVALRYFNVAGASDRLGEDHEPESHLIPNALRAALGGPELTIMGTDYVTPDGSCVRDYIHVEDLADAHASALELTATAQPGLEICNLGSGTGFSVLEVVETADAIIGRSVPRSIGPRRVGDPPTLVATNERAGRVLGWTPRRGTLEEMIGSAWRWRVAHPDGYADRTPG